MKNTKTTKIRKPWTLEDDEAMRKSYRAIGPKGMSTVLTGRTRKAIEQRAVYLSLTDPRREAWSAEEELLLSRLWHENGVKCIASFPGRTKNAIQQQARRMRLNCILARTPVEPLEEDALVESYKDKRIARSCFGYIPSGRVASVWEYAAAA